MFTTKVVRLTIPVTSPVPVVVAVAPMLRTKGVEFISRQPCVEEALALLKFRIPFTVIFPSAIFEWVPAPLMVRLL